MNRYGLTIGINDYAGAGDLAGCVNDALDMGHLLTERGYKTTTLLDAAATREAILDRLDAAVARLRYRDRLVIHFSGHGTKVPDSSGDEPDGWDECLVTADLNVIRDDDLAVIFDARRFGSRIVLVADSCYSGTVSRVGGFERLGATFDEKHPVRRRYLPPLYLASRVAAQAVAIRSDGRAPLADTPPNRSLLASSDVLLLSGASAGEYAYDSWWHEGDTWRPNGAFTYHLGRALDAGADDWRGAYRRVRESLPSTDYPQTPTLDGTYAQQRWGALD